MRIKITTYFNTR